MLLCLSAVKAQCAPLAQLDRASGYGPEGRGFESLTAYQERKVLKPLDFQGYQDFLLSEFSQISNAGRRPPPS